jgi:hypothetical protein
MDSYIFYMLRKLSVTSVFLFLICNSLTSVSYVLESPIYFCLPDYWLEVSVHPEGFVTGRLRTEFLGFSLFLSKF